MAYTVRHSPADLCPPAVHPTAQPFTVGDNIEPRLVGLSLEQAIRLALQNSNLVQTTGPAGSASLGAPQQVASVLDPAIQDSSFLFGQRGVAAALSDFDTQLATSVIWGRNELIQNNIFLSGGVLPGDTLVEETAIAQAQLQRNLRHGGQFAVSHNWNYNGSNRNDLLFPSIYSGDVTVQFRQPLLAGFGRAVTEVAGPQASALRGVTGVSQGVEIARINTSISIIDFEIAVAALLRDVETTYWQLYQAHTVINGLQQLLDRIHQIQQKVTARIEADAVGASVLEETEVEQVRLQMEIQLQNQRHAMLAIDAQLRRLLRVPLDPGAVYVATDRPPEAPIEFYWNELVAAAQANRPEIRRQRLQISQLRKQLNAAKNLARPSIDFVSSYQVNAFGDRLFAPDGPTDLESGYGRLFQGDETGWSLGFQYTKTVGRRLQLARVRNLQLQLAKATGVLNEQLAEVTSEIAGALREIDRSRRELELNQQLQRTTGRNRNASQSRFEAVGDADSLLIWLRAEQSASAGKAAALASLVSYASSLVSLHHRSGTILQLNTMTVTPSGSEIVWHTRSTLPPMLLEDGTETAPDAGPQPHGDPYFLGGRLPRDQR